MYSLPISSHLPRQLSSAIVVRESVSALLNDIISPTRILLDTSVLGQGGNAHIWRVSHSLEFVPSSLFFNSFIWSRFGYARLAKKALALIGDSAFPSYERIAILRQGSYETRVDNYSELCSFLLSEGFHIIDPSRMSHLDLVSCLKHARTIVSESGTCVLNALSFSPSTSKVLALVPERLIKAPDFAMIRGGLPYLYAFPDRTSILTCHTKRHSPIPSSDIVHVDIRSLSLMLRKLSSTC